MARPTGSPDSQPERDEPTPFPTVTLTSDVVRGEIEPSRKGRVRRLLKSPLATNIAALYGFRIGYYLLPVVTIPYLSRTLGSRSWGLLAFAQALGTYLAFLIEYGFGLSGTREVSRRRNEAGASRELLVNNTVARVVLSLLAIVSALSLREVVPNLRANGALFWMMVAWAIAQGHSAVWFFQGLERVRLIFVFELSTRVVATGALFVMVKRPADVWKVMALQAAAACLSSGVGLAYAARIVSIARPTYWRVRGALREGASAFVQRGLAGLHDSLSVIIVGAFLSAGAVGVYASADKLTRTVLLLFITPLVQGVYPRLSYLRHRDPVKAWHVLTWAVCASVAIGLTWGTISFVATSGIVRVVFGAGFSQAASLMRVLSLGLPFLAATTVLMSWSLAGRSERSVNRVLFLCAIGIGGSSSLAAVWTGNALAVAWVSTGGTIVTAAIFGSLVIHEWKVLVRGQVGFAGAPQSAAPTRGVAFGQRSVR